MSINIDDPLRWQIPGSGDTEVGKTDILSSPQGAYTETESMDSETLGQRFTASASKLSYLLTGSILTTLCGSVTLDTG